MRVGVRGTHFGARIADLEIGAGRDVRFLQRPGEARPARAGIVLVQRREERLAGDDVHVDPRLVVVPVLVGEGALGPRFLGHIVLEGRQLLSQLRVGWLLEAAGPPFHLLFLLGARLQSERQNGHDGDDESSHR